MSDTSKREEHDDGRIRIWVNSGAKMSRGKYAAAAVHAALAAAGVHPGVPVIVLGGDRDQIESLRTVIHDAGRTEVEPGTATAGTDYVFEQAHTPSDDERTLLAEVDALIDSWDRKGSWSSDSPVGLVMRLASAFRRRTAVQEPSAAPTVRDHVRRLTGATDAELDELGGLQGETEWEWGSEGKEGTSDPDPRPLEDDRPYWPQHLTGVREPTREQAESVIAAWNEGDPESSFLIRRRKAGPWMPVEGEGAMTAADRSRRQSAADRTGRPARIEAVTRDLLADVDYYSTENSKETP